MIRAAKAPASGQAAEPQVLVRDGDHLIFSQGRLLVPIWKLATRPDAVERLVKFAAELAARLAPSRFCLLVIVEETAIPPPAAVRAALARMLQLSTPHLIRFATVIEGTGFRAAAVRGVMTSIAVLSRQEIPHRVFSSAELALRWLVEGLSDELGTAPSVEDLVRSLEGVRRAGLSGTTARSGSR